MEAELKVLILEDVPEEAELILRELKRGGFQHIVSLRVEARAAFISALDVFKPAIILSDFTMATFDGLSALEIARHKSPGVPFIFVSGTIGEERAIEALKHGAMDYVLKSNLARLVPSVHRAMQQVKDREIHIKSEQELRASEERFSSFMSHLPGVAFIKDFEGRLLFANTAWERVFKQNIEKVLGKTDHELWPPHIAAQLRMNDLTVIESMKPLETIEMVPDAMQERQWLVNKFPIIGTDGKKMIGGIAIDITERRLQQYKIARLTRIYAVLSGINSTIVRIHDRNQLLQESCRIAVEEGKFGLAWIGMLEQDTQIVRPAAYVTWDGTDGGGLVTNRSANSDLPEGSGIAGQSLRNKIPVVCNDIEAEIDKGFNREEAVKRGFLSIIALPLLVESISVGVMVLYAKERDFFDEEELKLLNELAEDISFALKYIDKEEKLDYLAYYDSLTGLANKTLFMERLKQFVNSAKYGNSKLAVIITDLDRFKAINDTMGLHMGDTLLKMVADSLAGSIKGTDKVARIGADRFALVFPGITNAENIAHIIERNIMTCFNQPFTINGNELRISAKVGIALFPSDGDNEDTLFKNAESAVKRAKVTGDKYLFYTQEMTEIISEKLRLENRLRSALDKEEFILYYQPKVNLVTGNICGLEALIRWNDPETGLVPPGKFIPILEETGLILDVGTWVLHRAASDYRDWQKLLESVPRIAVNVSAFQLAQKDFVSQVEKAIRRGGKPVPLDIEITESLIMTEIEQNITKLKAIRLAGLGVAIDDFGTGYSSLSYITRLPIDAIKIDRSFITSMTDNPENMTLVSTIITLAHALRFKVIAEGVETEEQAKLLRLLKCDEMQGYLFSKPLPPAALLDLLHNHQDSR